MGSSMAIWNRQFKDAAKSDILVNQNKMAIHTAGGEMCAILLIYSGSYDVADHMADHC